MYECFYIMSTFYRLTFELSDSESDGSENDSVVQYYRGDSELPMFSANSCGYHAETVAQCLLNPVPDKVCHVRPIGVTTSATFIVDVDDVQFANLKADDLGVWKTNGTKTTLFHILPNGNIFILSSKRRAVKGSDYVLTRRYYVHGTYQQFRRIIVDIRGKSFRKLHVIF